MMDRFDTFTPPPVRVIFSGGSFTADATEAHRAIPLVRDCEPEAKAPVIPRGALRQPAKPRVERPAVEAGPSKPRVPPPHIERAVALYRDGASVKGIAAECKISLSAAYWALREAGVSMRKRLPQPRVPKTPPTRSNRPLDAEIVAAIVARRIAGESYIAIAPALGLRRERVRKALLRASLTNPGLAKAMKSKVPHPSGQARRGNRCVQGHELTPDNVTWRLSGDGRRYRRCKICERVASATFKRKWYEKRRLELGLKSRKTDVERIRQMHSQGAKTREIATEMGLNVSTVSRWLRKITGVKRPHHRHNVVQFSEREQLVFEQLEAIA